MSFAGVYPHYVKKAERKGRTQAELDEVIRWLTGYSQAQLESCLSNKTDFETFFAEAPQLNPARAHITGVICGVRIEEIEEPTMREIRYLDKLIEVEQSKTPKIGLAKPLKVNELFGMEYEKTKRSRKKKAPYGLKADGTPYLRRPRNFKGGKK